MMTDNVKAKNCISLFTGAGGLDLGLEKAGFNCRLCVECDSDCLTTLSTNRPNWLIAKPNDICKIRSADLLKQAGLSVGNVDLLAGGAPCQPFSMSGYWVNGDSKRLLDNRSLTINHFMRIVEGTLPKTILFENVKGIGFKKKDEALKYIGNEFKKINKKHSTKYSPKTFVLTASDFGVPQKRERLFIIAERNGREFNVPEATHLPKLQARDINNGKKTQNTAWDAIGDLDPLSKNVPSDLQLKGKWGDLIPSIPEGQNYLWHTDRGGGVPIFGWRTRYWSFLLKLSKFEPSWTLQATPGPATGPFHWSNRLLSIRELCRLQTFPDDYIIHGTYRSAVKQIGNSIPPAIGELLGKQILYQFFKRQIDQKLVLLPEKKCTRNIKAEVVMDVPQKYTQLIGKHAPHPGVGKGPRKAQMNPNI